MSQPPAGQRPFEAREIVQETIKRVNAQLNTADMRKACLGLACELVAPVAPGIGYPFLASTTISVAEELMRWVITGQRDGQKADE